MICPITGEPICKCRNPYSHFNLKFNPTLQTTIRKLFCDKVILLRSYIISYTNKLPDTDFLLTRIGENDKEISKFFQNKLLPEKLAFLLEEQTARIGELISCIWKNKNTSACESVLNLLFDETNINLAKFLSTQLNKSYSEIKNQLDGQIQFILNMLMYRKSQNWGLDLREFDSYHVAMLNFADLMAMN